MFLWEFKIHSAVLLCVTVVSNCQFVHVVWNCVISFSKSKAIMLQLSPLVSAPTTTSRVAIVIY